MATQRESAELSTVELRVFVQALLTGRWILLGAALLVAAAFAFLTLRATMVFTAKGSLYIAPQADFGTSPTSAFDFYGFDASSRLATEIEILRSREIVRSAIEHSGLNASVREAGVEPVRFLKWLTSGRELSLLEPRIDVRDVRLDERVGTAKFEVVFAQGGLFEISGKSGKTAGRLGAPVKLPGLTITLASSSTPAAGRSIELAVQSSDRAFEFIGKRLATKIPDSDNRWANVITLTFTDASPFQAQRFVNAMMGAYLEERLRWKIQVAEATESFVAMQIGKLGESLDRSENQLATYKSSSGFVIPEEEASKLLQELGRYEEQRTGLRLQISAIEGLADALKRPDAPIEAFMIGETPDAVLQELSKQLAAAQQELKKLSERMTEGAPEVRMAQALVERQRQMVQTYLATRLERLRQQLKSLDRVVNDLDARVGQIPAAQRELLSLERSREVVAKLYTFLLEKQQEAALTKASTLLGSRVLESALVPRAEDGPSILRIPQGFMVGLVLGAIVVLLRFFFRTTFHSQTEIREAFPTATFLAQVPRHVSKDGSEPTVGADMAGPFLEAFRTLRANLYFLAKSGQKVVLVSSASPGDGKTLLSSSMAASLAMDGKSVLLIDADLRAGRQHRLLKLEDTAGLADALRGAADWKELCRTVEVGTTAMTVLTKGTKGRASAELLGSPAFAGLLEEARETYDFIVVDSPPFPLTADALLLTRVTDMLLSVIRLGRGSRRASIEHVTRLSSAAKIHAIIVNDASLTDSYGYAYGYAYSSSYARYHADPTADEPKLSRGDRPRPSA
ncbi:MAG: polysaccharide biosynthesis tyrosine autokinase [Deltaproteobacteria bacterium]|nr:polysaccharide biosynthesis tyrosine autokinase [Deltaproteobacteria bacterium]